MKKLTILFLLTIFLGCSKDDSSDSIPDENPYHQNAEVTENVIVISDENTNLLSSDTDLSNGIYTIEFNDGTPVIKTNDIIVGDEGEGFLRKVVSVNSNGNTITLQTSQAKIDDVFNNATIEFTTDITESSKMANGKSKNIKVNYLKNGVTIMENGLEYDFSNTTLYDEAGLTFQITNGTATFDPNFNFKADYSIFTGLDYLNFETNNANLTIDCDLSLNVSGNTSLPEFSETLADFDKRLTFLVAGIPVIVVINTQLVAELNAGIDANVLVTSGFTNNYTLTSGVKYENDNWTYNFDLGSDLTPKPIDFSGQVNISQNLTITPRVSVKFYSVIGPFCEPKMTEDFAFNIASPSLDWDSNLKVGLDITTGIDVTIFGYVEDFSRTDSFEEIIWNAPETLEIVSGNNQTGNQGEQLTEPLRVLVKDKLENTLPFVPVHFTVTQGNGTVDNESVMTDENGIAEVFWTLGDNTDPQTVEVNVKKADGTNIESSANFNANSEDNQIDLSGVWSLTFSATGCSTEPDFNNSGSATFVFNNDNTISLADLDYFQIASNTYSLNGNIISINYHSINRPSFSCTDNNGNTIDSYVEVGHQFSVQTEIVNNSFVGEFIYSEANPLQGNACSDPNAVHSFACSGTVSFNKL